MKLVAARRCAPMSPPAAVPRTTVVIAALSQRGRPYKHTLASTQEPRNPAKAKDAITKGVESRSDMAAVRQAIG